MNFKVVFATPTGTSTRKYQGTDTYELIRGGVLRIDVQRAPDQGVYYFAPGQWVEVAEGGDPITPRLGSDE